MIKSVIFDFNGTLFNDDDINIIAWRKTYKLIMGSDDGFEEMKADIISFKNSVTIERLLKIKGINPTPELVKEWALKKEYLYQEYIIENNRTDLMPGAEKLLDYIKAKNLKIGMATASIDYNVGFYFRTFKLDRWFDRKEVVFDDYKHASKYEMYLDVIEKMNLNGDEILLFDDSYSSIGNGINAGIKNVVRLNPCGKPSLNHKEIIQEIKNFEEFDYAIFNK